MKKERRKHDAAVKTKVVLEVIRGQKTLSQISSEYGVHPNQITNWKRQFLQALPETFEENCVLLKNLALTSVLFHKEQILSGA